MTDFRALCTELVEAWDSYSYADAGDAADRMAEAVKAARAALVQPAPPAEGEAGEPVAVGQPTDAQLLELYPLSMINLDDAFAFARAVLARWGHQSTPPVEGEMGELVHELRSLAGALSGLHLPTVAATATRAAELLQQRHAEPVPVSERPWNREGWCDAGGRCWLLTLEDGYPQWRLHSIKGVQLRNAMIMVTVDTIPMSFDGFWASHCLPFYALPLPAGEGEE